MKNMAIWDLAFRPFFLFGSVFAILAMVLWGLFLNGSFVFEPYGDIRFWHIHEMLFGFIGAIIIGFLLTAVQTWTGLRSAHGYSLIALFSLWLISRVAMLGLLPLPAMWIAALDVGTYLFATFLFGRLLFLTGNFRNMILILVLIMFALTNLFTHASKLFNIQYLFNWGTHSAVMLITLLMMVIGGRVIPLFTGNALKMKLPVPVKKLEIATIASTTVLTILYLSNSIQKLPGILVAGIFLFAAVCHMYRSLRWFNLRVLSNPMLWSLQLSYWFIPVSFVLFTAHYAGWGVSHSTAIHGLTAGAMSSLILSMISRVSLGHTGRPIKALFPMQIGFTIILLAGLTRVLIDLFFEAITLQLYVMVSLVWCLPFALFVVLYTGTLIKPRPDSKT